jgi:hypothetical protein
MMAYLVRRERKDENLSSTFAHLIHETIPLWCGQSYNAGPAVTDVAWKWNGPDSRLADSMP